jgi:hypothetical protein
MSGHVASDSGRSFVIVDDVADVSEVAYGGPTAYLAEEEVHVKRSGLVVYCSADVTV